MAQKVKKATGTDDQAAGACKSAYKELTTKPVPDGNTSCSCGDSDRPESGIAKGQQRKCKPLEIADLGNKKGRLSSSDTGLESNERCRARTCDPLIKSQLPKTRNYFVNKEVTSATPSGLSQILSKTTCEYPELVDLIKKWAGLSEELRGAVLRMVDV